MTIPSGVQKQVIFGKQAALGTPAVVGSGKIKRRVSAAINLVKSSFESNEQRSDQQTVDFRHGTRKVDGSLNGELSCLTYQELMEAVFRSAFAAGATTGAVVTIAADNLGTFTRSAGSFIADGFKVGDLVLVAGFVTSANNGQWLVLGVTATVLTVAVPDTTTMVDEAAGASVTILVDGKKLQVPSSGHTRDYFTVEQLYEMGATDVSELASDLRVGSMSIQIQPNGMATINFGVMGRDMTSDASSYFTAPAVETVTAVLAGAQGALYMAGVAIAVVTGLTIDQNGDMSLVDVVGAPISPDVFNGRFKVTGQFTALFENDTMWQNFKNETELSLVFKLTGGTDQAMVLKLPRIKLGGASKDDKENGPLVQTVPFTALRYVGGSSVIESTTMVVQDTEAV